MMKLSMVHRAGGDRRIYAEIKEQDCRDFVERALVMDSFQ